MGLLCLSGRGSARAEDAPGTPSQSHISPSVFSCTKIVILATLEWKGSCSSSSLEERFSSLSERISLALEKCVSLALVNAFL